MSIIKRFWTKVNKRGPDDCWEWLGKPGANGYGRFRIKGNRQEPHRISWAIAYRTWPIPKDKYICHKCNNKLCVNPAHLYLGTPAQNQQDASSLTLENVQEIRYLREFEGYSYDQLSFKFNVTVGGIGNICNKKRWKNV